MIYCIDANVIVRYLTQDNNILSPKADAIIEGIEDGLFQAYCDPIILAEVVWVLTSVYQIDKAKLLDGLGPVINLEGLVVPNKQRYIHALELFAGRIPHFGDACACAAAIEACDGRLFSFDKKLSSIEGVIRTEQP